MAKIHNIQYRLRLRHRPQLKHMVIHHIILVCTVWTRHNGTYTSDVF